MGGALRLVTLATALALALAATVPTSGADHGNVRGCPTYCPPRGTSDLRAIAVSGPALKGYLDPHSGLRIRLLKARVGHLSDGGRCFSYLSLHASFQDTRHRAITFDPVGLIVQDQASHVYRPFGWGTYPSHGVRIGPLRTWKGWLPYGVGELQQFVVQWANTYDPAAVLPDKPPYAVRIPHRTFHYRITARYTVQPTGTMACR